MDKIKLKICMGRTCYIKGSSILAEKIESIIEDKYSGRIELILSGCMGFCVKNWDNPKSPYVKINDELIEEATIEKIINMIENLIRK